MKAQQGDKLTISGHRVGEPKRVGRIEEVRGVDGAPPYKVRWMDSDHVTLLFPGPDCSIEPMDAHAETEGVGR